jgi:hypothetical protein
LGISHFCSLHIIPSEILSNDQILDQKIPAIIRGMVVLAPMAPFSLIEEKLDRQSLASLLDPASRSTATMACTDEPTAA